MTNFDFRLTHLDTCFDFGITKISTDLDGELVTLYDSNKVSVYSLQPVLRAACNENDHFATHYLTIPSLLCSSSIEVKISDKILLKSTSIEIVTSKIDKKYVDEQGGTGEKIFHAIFAQHQRKKFWILKSSSKDSNLIELIMKVSRELIIDESMWIKLHRVL